MKTKRNAWPLVYIELDNYLQVHTVAASCSTAGNISDRIQAKAFSTHMSSLETFETKIILR